MPQAPIIAHGTAMLAFVASSLMCKDESNAPGKTLGHKPMRRRKQNLPMDHKGARKLRMKAKPFGHPYTGINCERMLQQEAETSYSS